MGTLRHSARRCHICPQRRATRDGERVTTLGNRRAMRHTCAPLLPAGTARYTRTKQGK